jgi:predicted PurR-regulated permease PerM
VQGRCALAPDDRLLIPVPDASEAARTRSYPRRVLVAVGIAVAFGALRVPGVPVAFLLAVIAALLTFVPNFGPLIAAIPAVLLAFVQGPTTALWVVGLYLAIQFVKGNVLDP